MKKMLIRLSFIEALYFGLMAVIGYQTTFLIDAGLDSAQIGYVFSLATLAGMISAPIWGMISDKLHSARLPLLLCVIFLCILYTALPLLIGTLTGSPAALAIYFMAAYLFKQPANSLLDAWGVQQLSPHNLPYGTIRKWGSLGFTIISLLLSTVILRLVPIRSIFFLLMFLAVPFVLLWYRQVKTETVTDGGKAAASVPMGTALKGLIHNSRLFCYLLFSMGLNIYLFCTFQFMPYILHGAGVDDTMLGLVVGVRSMFEILSMFIISRINTGKRTGYILAVSGLLFGAEHFFYPLASGLSGMICVISLSGLAGGIYYSTGPLYIHSIVEPEVQNTAQTLASVFMGLTGIIGTFIGGIVIESMGIHALTRGSSAVIFVLTCFFILHLSRNKNLIKRRNLS